jgi:ATP-binding cassette subfamily B protein
VRDADEILVLDGGRVAAQGAHVDLMRDSSIYAEIYSSQLQDERDLMPELGEEDLALLNQDWQAVREVAQ